MRRRKVKISNKSYLSPLELVKRRYRRFKIFSLSAIVLLVAGLGAIVYVHYDYMLFRTLIAQHYIHTQTLDGLFAAHLGFVPDEDRYGRYFDNLVISIVTREIRQAGGDGFTYQYTPAQHVAQQEGVRARAAAAVFDEVAPGVGYLFLPNISPYVRQFVESNRDDINAMDNLILDLRGNNGGTLDDFQAIAGLFLEAGITVGRETARWDMFSSHRRSRGAQFFYFDNIIILQNDRTASAAEGLILALNENLDNVTTVGYTTFGKGIGQVTLPLRGGFAVRATVILMEAPSGFTVHDIGILPDIEFFGDDIINFALGLLP